MKINVRVQVLLIDERKKGKIERKEQDRMIKRQTEENRAIERRESKHKVSAGPWDRETAEG